MARDYSKYDAVGVGKNLNKRELVREIVANWASTNNPSYLEIQNIFPDRIQGSYGFIRKESEVSEDSRFNLKNPIVISDGSRIVVSNQWGKENILKFIDIAEKLGYSISIINDTAQEVSSNNESKEAFDFSNTNPKSFRKMIEGELENESKLLDLRISLIHFLNENPKNRDFGWCHVMMTRILSEEGIELILPDDVELNYDIYDETYFIFNPERQDESSWASTSDYVWTDPNSEETGSFLELLIKREGITDIDESLLDINLDNAALTYLWFSMSKHIQQSTNIDNEELATLMWTVFEDPFHKIHEEIDYYGETPGFNAMGYVIEHILRLNEDQYNAEENDELEWYGDYSTDYQAVAQRIIDLEIYDMF